jgi:hypothetical protein
VSCSNADWSPALQALSIRVNSTAAESPGPINVLYAAEYSMQVSALSATARCGAGTLAPLKNNLRNRFS